MRRLNIPARSFLVAAAETMDCTSATDYQLKEPRRNARSARPELDALIPNLWGSINAGDSQNTADLI